MIPGGLELNKFSLTGLGQTYTYKTTRSGIRYTHGRIRNNGPVADDFLIKGSPSNSFFAVNYRIRKGSRWVNATGAFLKGQAFFPLGVGEDSRFSVGIRPKSSTRDRKSTASTFLLNGRNGNNRDKDVVGVKVVKQ